MIATITKDNIEEPKHPLHCRTERGLEMGILYSFEHSKEL